MRAELGKLVTLPSLRWTAALTWAATVLIAFAVHRAAPGDDPIRVALRWTQGGFAVLGVLAATQEYESGGQVRATLLAVPRRLPLAGAKFAALAVVALVLAAPLGTPYPVSVAVVGAALGLLLRSSMGGVATALTTYLVACPVVRARFPGAGAWLPDAGLLHPSGGTTSALWSVAAVVIASLVLHRRNA